MNESDLDESRSEEEGMTSFPDNSYLHGNFRSRVNHKRLSTSLLSSIPHTNGLGTEPRNFEARNAEESCLRAAEVW